MAGIQREPVALLHFGLPRLGGLYRIASILVGGVLAITRERGLTGSNVVSSIATERIGGFGRTGREGRLTGELIEPLVNPRIRGVVRMTTFIKQY